MDLNLFTFQTDMTDTQTALEVREVLATVDVQDMLEESAQKGIEASNEATNRVRVMLEQTLSTANFNLVDDLNEKFSAFLQYDAIRQRLNVLLEMAQKSASGQDIGGALDDAMEDIQEITEVLNTAGTVNGVSKFFGNIFNAFRHGFKSQQQIFLYGIRDLKGKVEMVEQIIGTEKTGIRNTIDMVRQYLPAVTEDVIRLEYLSRFLEEFLNSETGQGLGKDAQEFLREYHMAIQTMKQVSSVSVLRVMMGLNRIVKAKSHLDKVEMKFTMNLGTLVFENLINNQLATSYKIADSIELGIEALNERNAELDDQLRQTEIDNKEKHLRVLKGLEGKLVEIKADYESYHNELDRINAEVEAFLPQYNETYDELVDMREGALNREKATGEAMATLLGSDAWSEDKLIAENEQINVEREALSDEITSPTEL